MYFPIRQGIRELEFDTQQLQKKLNLLSINHASWSTERLEIDLKQIIEYATQLELDIGILKIMLTDSLSDTHQYSKAGALAILGSLHWAYAVLNTFLNDIKKTLTTLNETYIRPDELERLFIDWRRFRKTLGPIQRQVQDEETLLKSRDLIPKRKIHAVLHSQPCMARKQAG